MPTLRLLLSDSLGFLRRHIAAVLFLVLVIYVPIELLLSALPFDDEQVLKSLGRAFRMQRLLETFVGVICTMALAHLVLADHEQRALPVRDSLWLAASRWRASIGTQFLLGFLYLGALLALVLPLFFVWIATFFTIPLVALRELAGSSAIKASWALVRGRWWAVFRLVSLLTLVQLTIVVVVAVPTGLLPDLYLLDVLSSLLIDVSGTLFTVAAVKLMFHLEKHPVAVAPDPVLSIQPV